MRKRGELSSFQIALFIFAILGLIVGVLFFISVKDSNYSSDQLCKISVLSRATIEKAIPATGSAVPLQCTTKKICLTMSNSGSCDQFKGEDPNTLEKVVLSSTSSLAIHTIEQKSAEAMYNCWESMGEGKLDIFNNVEDALGLDSTKPTCVICSRIAVAKDVPKEWINEVNVNSYLKNNYIPGTSITYIQAFSDQATNTYSVVNENVLSDPKFKSDKSLSGLNGIYSTIKSDTIIGLDGKEYPVNREMAYVFMQIKSKDAADILKNQLAVGATVAGGAFVASQAPVLGSGIRLIWNLFPTPAKVIGTLAVASVVGGFGAYNAYQGQQVAAGYCGQFVSKDEKGNQGCSLVEGVNYNVNDINTLCNTIQGNP